MNYLEPGKPINWKVEEGIFAPAIYLCQTNEFEQREDGAMVRYCYIVPVTRILYSDFLSRRFSELGLPYTTVVTKEGVRDIVFPNVLQKKRVYVSDVVPVSYRNPFFKNTEEVTFFEKLLDKKLEVCFTTKQLMEQSLGYTIERLKRSARKLMNVRSDEKRVRRTIRWR